MSSTAEEINRALGQLIRGEITAGQYLERIDRAKQNMSEEANE